MKRIKNLKEDKTESEKEEQRLQDIVHSGLFSLISFIFSVLFLISNLVSDCKITHIIIDAVALFLFLVLCILERKIVKKKVNKEHNYSINFIRKIEKISLVLGYCSFILLLATILIDLCCS